jgi:prepilin-type N-terminal cleavage/methylation domain-containing protein
MRLSRNSSNVQRGGFTLIELLVVIGIIAVLVSLTAAAVMKTLVLGPRAVTSSEISQLEGGVSGFQAQYQVPYIPSRIILRKYYQDYFSATGVPLSQLDLDSVNYLTLVFKKGGQKFVSPNPQTPGSWQLRGIAWNSNWANGAPLSTFEGVEGEQLEGEQCLVFFLGGIQATSNGTNASMGFSTDDANPDLFQTPTRNSFYDFKSSRLIVPPNKPNATFFAYEDGFTKNVYAYFSSYGVDNGYAKYATLYGNSDCNSLGVWPYAQSPASGTLPTIYMKPRTCQIISAGKDGLFGPGTNLTLPVASQLYYTASTAALIRGAGADDQTNFTSGLLSSPQ